MAHPQLHLVTCAGVQAEEQPRVHWPGLAPLLFLAASGAGLALLLLLGLALRATPVRQPIA